MTHDWEAALQAGDVGALVRMLDHGADVNALDRHGQTSLMRAARDGRLDLVRLLIERNAGLNQTGKYRLTALMLAVIAGHEDVVGALCEAGADLDVRGSGAPGFQGKTALDLAKEAGRVGIVRRLQAG
jgi:uncharacterized protein